VTENAEIVARAPLFLPKFLIKKYFFKYEKKLLAQKEKVLKAQKKFQNGEKFLFLGKSFSLFFGDFSEISFREKTLFFPKNSKNPRADLKHFYQKMAKKILFSRVDFWAKKVGHFPKKVRISAAKTRWGSLSAAGTISLSWRLILAPPFAIDAVVAHEMAHFFYPDHSKNFWKKVAEIFPDFRRGHDFLRENAIFLRL